MALGIPRDEMLGRMSSREVTEWMAYASVEPFGEDRGDLRAALICSVIANANRDPKKKADPYQPIDFMPFAEKPEPSPEALAGKIARMLGGS